MHDRSKGPNLVIGPTVALMQWKNEIENTPSQVCLKFYFTTVPIEVTVFKNFHSMMSSLHPILS